MTSDPAFGSLIQKIQAAIVVHDSDTKIIAGNAKAQELLGLTEDQMLGRVALDPGWRFLNADDQTMPQEEYPVNRVLAEKRPLRDLTVGIYRPQTDVTVWVQASADPVFDNQGRIEQVIVTFMDITERRRMEQALLQSQAFLNATGMVANVGGWEFDARTREIRWTDQTYRIAEIPLGTELSLDEVVALFHPDDIDGLLSAFQRALDQGVPYNLEVRIITPGGREIWTRTICDPHLVDGQVVSLIGTFQDITDRKLAERERERLIEELEGALANVKTLSGLLPICASCKKIRDDKGYWNQIEKYIQEHSQVDFTHSICPECAARLYPGWKPKKIEP